MEINTYAKFGEWNLYIRFFQQNCIFLKRDTFDFLVWLLNPTMGYFMAKLGY